MTDVFMKSGGSCGRAEISSLLLEPRATATLKVSSPEEEVGVKQSEGSGSPGRFPESHCQPHSQGGNERPRGSYQHTSVSSKSPPVPMDEPSWVPGGTGLTWWGSLGEKRPPGFPPPLDLGWGRDPQQALSETTD